MECQVCFEAVDVDGQDGNQGTLLTKLCSNQCPAQICTDCLTRHVEVVLEQFYAGLLPKIRCPICLALMTSDRWQPRVSDASSAVARYEKLCRQACALRPPCCHKMEYTHLPAVTPDTDLIITGDSGPPVANIAAYQNLLGKYKTRPGTLVAFLERLARFSGHSVRADSAVALADVFVDMAAGDVKVGVTNSALLRLLPTVRDSERRATLLLAYLFKRPITRTLCCNAVLCFNCKRTGRHDNCSASTFNEDSAVVQCRGCHATLLKVDGCDSVVCLCGFKMSWVAELEYRRNHIRGFYAVSIFDARFDDWIIWRARLRRPMSLVDFKAKARAFRLVLNRPETSESMRTRMAPAIRRWKFRRYQRIIGEHLDRTPSAKRQRLQDVERFLAKVGGILAPIASEHVAWTRWKRRMAPLQSELFWAIYWRDHPQELSNTREDQDELLGVFSGL